VKIYEILSLNLWMPEMVAESLLELVAAGGDDLIVATMTVNGPLITIGQNRANCEIK
jgi:hypothetical protein